MKRSTSKYFGAFFAVMLAASVLTNSVLATTTTYTDPAAFASAVSLLGTADGAVVDFESFSGGDLILSGDTVNGVTFLPTLEPGLGLELAIRSIGGSSGANTLGSSDDNGVNVGQLALGETIDFTFDQPTSAFGLFIIVSSNFDLFEGDVTINFGGDSVMNAIGLPPMVNGQRAAFLGIVDDMGSSTMANLTFGTAGDIGGLFFEVDDIQFTTPSTEVPEPTSLWLLTTAGLLGLCTSRLKKRG